MSQLSRAFFAGNYLLELFETECYFRVIKSDPVPSFEVIASTFRKFLEVLMDPHWGTTLNTFSADQETSKTFKYVLKSVNFENLLFALRFCANFKLKLQNYFQTSVQKIQIHNVIYDFILALLVLLMSLPKQLSTKQQRNQLKSIMETHAEMERQLEEKPKLLTNVCNIQANLKTPIHLKIVNLLFKTSSSVWGFKELKKLIAKECK